MFISGIYVRSEGDWYVGGDARRLDEVLLFLMPLELSLYSPTLHQA